jgi:tRNA threonylcarbamoyladenosine biosynthesis protein TsaB
MLAAHWPPNAPAPLLVDDRRAPDVIWVARVGAAADPERAKARPLYLRQPDATPRDTSVARQ